MHVAISAKKIISVKFAWLKFMVEWVRCGPGFFAVITIVSGLEKCAGVLTHTNTSSHCMPTLIITYMARLNIDHQLHGNISYLYGKIEHWSSPSRQHWSSLIWQDWTLIITFMATLIITYMARLNIDHHLHGKLIITYIVRLNIDQHGNIDHLYGNFEHRVTINHYHLHDWQNITH